MNIFNTHNLAEASGGREINGSADFSGFATDSRYVEKNNLFICIKGARTNGHLYVSAAEKAGAAAVLSEEELQTKLPYVIVKSTVKAIQDFAVSHRKGFDTKLVAVTGSVGKTTTKEFIHAVLSAKYKTHKSEGNKNSETGLPISLLGINNSHEAAVLEMGMSALGEIELLSKIAAPDIAVITNIGYSHIEHLGSRENILKAKLEIIAGMKPESKLILNADDEFLRACKNVHPNTVFWSFGCCGAEYMAQEIYIGKSSVSLLAVTPIGDMEMEIPVLGIHNVGNAMAAIAVGVECGMSLEEIRIGLLSYKNPPSRQNIYEKNGITIFDDCYNAVPSSFEAAFEVLKLLDGRKIAVLGDMLELGDFSELLHFEVGKKLGFADMVFLYGNFAESYAKGAKEAGLLAENVFVFSSESELSEKLVGIVKKGDVVFFKASRGMLAEKIIQKLSENI